MPQVHLGIDPEFSMKTGKKPGSVIGTMDAADINFTIKYLTDLAKANQLPPKILVVHRFTQAMMTNYKKIKPSPEVQVVMDMDGWGAQSRKLSTYREFISKEPVQFTGFKLFYKNDFQGSQQPNDDTRGSIAFKTQTRLHSVPIVLSDGSESRMTMNAQMTSSKMIITPSRSIEDLPRIFFPMVFSLWVQLLMHMVVQML